MAEFAARLHARGVPVHYARVAPGLAVLDDLDDQSAGQLAAGLPDGGVLCVATYDPATASPGLRRALLATAHEERVLAPLGRADIAQIVARVAGPVDAALVEEIVLAAHGRPGEAERLATRLVEERSARRVVAAVEQAGPASQALAAARDEVASGVRDLARVRARHGGRRPARMRIACPYKGLARYEPSDAPLFHGREELVARLCARLVDTAFVAVVGPSGAGKSSLVRAGLLPALAAGVLPGLADAAAASAGPRCDRCRCSTGPAVVVVDQFEEVFAAITDDVARQRYLDDLTALAARPGTRVVVVLRGDFVGACAAHARLAQAARRRHRAGRADAPGGDPPRGRAARPPGWTAQRTGAGRRGRVGHAGRAGRAAADVHGARRGVAGPFRRHADGGGVPPRRRGARRAGPAGGGGAGQPRRTGTGGGATRSAAAGRDR